MNKKTLLSLGVVFLLMGSLTLLGYCFYIGLFSSVKVEAKRFGPVFLVYRSQVGDYRQTARTVGEILQDLQRTGVSEAKGFAIYYDDPAKVKQEELRSEAGVLLADKDRERAAGVIQRYQSREFPALDGAVASFPLRNAFSIFIGAYKVYPALVRFLEKAGSTPGYSMEVYDFGKTTTYFMPFSEQKI